MIRSRPVSLALVGLFLWMTGCTSYKQVRLDEVADHGRVRVTLASGERQTLHDPWVEGDSIKGRVKAGRPSPQWVDRVVSLKEVTGVEAVGTNEVGTMFTVLGVLALSAAIIVLVVCSEGNTVCFNVY